MVNVGKYTSPMDGMGYFTRPQNPFRANTLFGLGIHESNPTISQKHPGLG